MKDIIKISKNVNVSHAVILRVLTETACKKATVKLLIGKDFYIKALLKG